MKLLKEDAATARQIDVGYIEGDGIGPEITRQTIRVVDTVCHLVGDGRRIYWHELLAGQKAYAATGEWLPQQTLDQIEQLGLAIKGPLSTPVGEGIRSITVQLRKALNLYACVRPIKYIPGVPSPLKHPELVDMVVFRENTEDVYAGIEWASNSVDAKSVISFLRDHGTIVPEEAAIGIKVMTPSASQRLIRAAIKYAIQEQRQSVTLMHKGNIMKFTEGSFRSWGYELASNEFAKETTLEGVESAGRRVVIKDRIADNLFQQVITNPQDYDVIATPNLNGDYLSDALAAQIGGLGMAPGANMSDLVAVFEATHGSAPKYAGQDRMNPSSLILSAANLLRHVGWGDIAEVIDAGIERAIAHRVVTYDLARGMEGATTTSTTGFATAIIEGMKDYLSMDHHREERLHETADLRSKG